MNLHPSSLDGRGVFALRVVFVVAAMLALISCEPRRDGAMDVQLLLTTKEFEANSRFELRFPLDMVSAEQVGKTVKLSPLRVEPHLPGEFRWLSTRKGIYLPSEPPRLGTKYRFLLSSGLQNAQGQTVSLHLERTLETPPFRITNLRASYRQLTNVPVRPRMTIEFNAPVSITNIKSHFVFTADGREVPAVVSPFHGGYLPGFIIHPDRSRRASTVTLDWPRAFDRLPPLPPVTPAATEDAFFPPLPSAPPPPSLQPNVVSVTPSEVLTPGSAWKLQLRAGMPSTLPAVALKHSVSIPVGEVEVMRVLRVDARNDYDFGKRINVRFNRRPEDLNKVTVSPQPDKFSLTAGGGSVTLRGEFELNRSYLVTVAPDLVSTSGERLKEGFQTVVRFQPLSPMIRFPSFNVVQQAGGDGRFHLEAINTPRIDFRAKRLSPETYLQLLRGYDRYARGGSREIPFDLVPGPELESFWIASKVDPDITDRLNVDMHEVIGQGFGAIFVEASSRGLGSRKGTAKTQAILQHTDIGLLWKNHTKGSWVHAFSLADGSPLKDVKVTLMSRKSQAVAEVRTDASGIAQLTDEGRGGHLYVHRDHDINGIDRSSAELWRYGFDLPLRWHGSEESRALFFIDKPVCRPGETVRFKAIARAVGGEMSVPEGEPKRRVSLSINDPRGYSVLSTNLHLSDRGSVDFAFTTAKAKYGTYRARLNWGNAYKSVSFVVQDYEANAFEVKVGGPQRLLPEDAIELPIHARYFLGKDISSAKVTWSLQAADERFQPKGFEDFRFGDGIQDSRIVSGQDKFSVHGGGDISPTNDYTIRTNVPVDIVTPAPRRVQAIAEVTDLNQQTVTGQLSFLIDSSEYYLGLAKPEERLRVGDVYRPQVVAVDRFGKPVRSTVKATLRLRRADWHSVAIKGSGNNVRYRNELRLVDLFKTNAPVRSSGLALPPFARPGRHLLEAEGMDAKGNRIYSSIAFYVIGHDEADWEQRNGNRIDVEPDREEYRVGDVAEILVKSPIKGRALVSIERSTVDRTFSTNLTGNSTIIRIPLTTNDAPNTFVSVTVLRGADESPRKHKEPDFRYGYCQLNVVDDSTRLDIAATPDRTDYRPGEKVTIDVSVLDAAGQGVPNTEVTLYAVDEGVLSLRGYETPDPLALFNATRGLAVSTHLSLKHLQPADPAKINFWNKGFLVGGGGNSLSRGARTNFIACPLWKPNLVTDQDGKVSASFIAPDSLTRYRVIAVAHAGLDRFGHAENKFEIDKPLIVEPVLPRFARRGDQLNVRALLINQTEHDDTVELTWQRVGAALTKGPKQLTQRLVIKAGQAKTVGFPLTFTDTGTARWKWSARFLSTNVSSFADSVISQLRVEEPLPLMRASLIGTISGRSNLLAKVDPQILGGSGKVTVRVSNSPFIQLNGGMNYLLRYPYGCVEQTSSSLLPWIVIRRNPILHRLYQKTPRQIDEAIARGVDRLASMQLSSGGFGYWPGSRSVTPWGSAYAGLVLQLARQAGASITGIRQNDLARYLRDQLHRINPRLAPSFNESHATALYTLALLDRRETELYERLYTQRKQLSAETCAFAALAMLTGKPTEEERRMASDLLDESRSDTRMNFRSFGSRTRLRAVELMAYRRLDSDRQHDLIEKLLASRKSGRWLSTQANAWSLLALADIAKPNNRQVQARLAWGQESAVFDFADTPVQHEKTFELSAARSRLPLNLSLPGDATLYVEVDVSSHVDRKFDPVVDKGFKIKRYFHRLAADGSAERAENLEIGDTIVVTLDLTADEHSNYVAIDDPLPAVLQAINPEFKSQKSGKDEWSTANWHSSYRELRNDRALFFRDRLPAGNYRIQYLARVRADGQCAAPPSRVEEMYNPNRHGFSAPQRLEATR